MYEKFNSFLSENRGKKKSLRRNLMPCLQLRDNQKNVTSKGKEVKTDCFKQWMN